MLKVSREEFEKAKKDLEETKSKLEKITHDLGKTIKISSLMYALINSKDSYEDIVTRANIEELVREE